MLQSMLRQIISLIFMVLHMNTESSCKKLHCWVLLKKSGLPTMWNTTYNCVLPLNLCVCVCVAKMFKLASGSKKISIIQVVFTMLGIVDLFLNCWMCSWSWLTCSCSSRGHCACVKQVNCKSLAQLTSMKFTLVSVSRNRLLKWRSACNA